MQQSWFQLWGTAPFVGRHFAGWLWSDPVKAGALQLALKTCAGVDYEVLDANGNPVVPLGNIIPGWGDLFP